MAKNISQWRNRYSLIGNDNQALPESMNPNKARALSANNVEYKEIEVGFLAVSEWIISLFLG